MGLAARREEGDGDGWKGRGRARAALPAGDGGVGSHFVETGHWRERSDNIIWS